MVGAYEPRQLNAADSVWHRDVGENDVDIGPILQYRRCFGRAARRDNFVSDAPEQFGRQAQYVGVVFNQQHSLGSRWRRETDTLSLLGRGQIEIDARAPPLFARDSDVATGLGNKSVHLAKAKPCALASRLRGEEWLKCLRQNVVGHPR